MNTMMSFDKISRLKQAALAMRRNIIRLALNGGANGVHVGPALSLVEILACLYLDVLRRKQGNPLAIEDKFVLSKGHGALGYYVALYEAGVISLETLNTYEKNGGNFPGQPVKNSSAGIVFSSGTLGLGLAFGAGLALGARKAEKDLRAYVVLGDGELNEGSVWESVMFAAHAKLTNLVAIVDRNGMQSDGCTSDVLAVDIEAMWRGFGWDVIVCDGHNIEQLLAALRAEPCGKPRVVIANTIKGKGVSFMEGNNEWHHNRLTAEQYDQAVAELDALGVHGL
jgi:transketolase